MSNLLRSLLPDSLPTSPAGVQNALREAIQSMALLGLWRAKFFEQAAFYGGTALRILYKLDRFSEDLDFSLLQPSDSFDFYKYGASLENELRALGLEVTFESKVKKTISPIESAFLKANTHKQLILIKAPEEMLKGIHHQSLIKVKLEVDTQPPADFDTEIKYVFTPLQFAVRSFSLPSLFAGKLHALLFRKWKNRVKGRDWYDFAWFASKHPEINLAHLEARMRQSGDYQENAPLTLPLLKELLFAAIDKCNIEQAKEEAAMFVEQPTALQIWSKPFFIAATERLLEGKR